MTIINESLLFKYFPFKVPNPGQIEAIDRTIAALADITKIKHIVIEAPTGIGKSAVAYTIHHIMKYIRGKYRTSIITSTKGLQDQYVEEFTDIYNLKGKTNYGCGLNVGPYRNVECKKAIHTKKCDPMKSCDYLKTRVTWTDESDLRMTNHSFMIEACPTLVMDNGRMSNLIIIDESHELEENIVNHSTIKLNCYNYSQFSEVMKGVEDLIELIGNQKEEIFNIKYNIDSLISIVDKRVGWVKQQMATNTELISKYNTVSEYLDELIDSLYILKDDRIKWIRTAYEKEKSVEIKPIRAKYVSDHALFRKSTHFIHMTSTICGIESYCESLGIDPEECIYIEIDNPIPLENRKIHYHPLVKVSGNIDYDKLTNGIDVICNHHYNESGIIHTVSFQLANEIYKRSKNRNRMVVSNDRREIISHLSKKNGIVLSPSLERGFDAKGDLSRFQILSKVPYGYLGDPFIKYNSKMSNTWYARQAVLRLIQSCGRSVRGVNDYAETYILDTNFGRLYNDNKNLFPRWFRDAIVK